MPSPVLAYVDLAGGPEAALEKVPASAGVGQLVASDRRNLVVGSASNLRRWAASHLGLGKKPAAGKRPKTNLTGIAAAVGFAETRGPFHQRLAYERLLAPLVPLSARRDLKPPAFVQLDLGERFPRAVVTGRPEAAFGPFRDRRAADKAKDAVQKLFRLRPCDARFEPAADLPLGLACLYAQVSSCAAPCLGRVGEDAYRRAGRERGRLAGRSAGARRRALGRAGDDRRRRGRPRADRATPGAARSACSRCRAAVCSTIVPAGPRPTRSSGSSRRSTGASRRRRSRPRARATGPG